MLNSLKRHHMKGVSKGFDPELGKKFAQENSGSVIACARPSPKPSSQAKHEMPPGLDAQQQHEWENGWLTEDDL